MTLRTTLLAFLTPFVANGQTLDKTKPTVVRTSQISLSDRILTVKKLSGPPVRSITKEVPNLRQPQPVADIPTEYHFVHAVVCEDKRTYLEWWPLGGTKEAVSQGWSDLDWNHLGSTNQVRHLGRNHVLMTFVTRSTKEDLLRKGKPRDPIERRPPLSAAAPSSFTLCGPSAFALGSPAFMQAFHQHLQAQGIQKPIPLPKPPPAEAAGDRKPGRSTLTYWRNR